MIGILKRLFGGGTDYKALVANGALIVDVRTIGEFKSGHIKNALNIPVDTLEGKIKDLKQKGKPVITCCASGMRSAKAAAILKQNGIVVYNGGSWVSLSNRLN
jgi:phage shock protein E